MSRVSALALLAFAAYAESPLTNWITAASLRGRVSFLASDALEGRDTPSRGLEVAAEYIASEFRRAGLESPPGGDYFQNADFALVSDSAELPAFSLSGGIEVPADRIGVTGLRGAQLTNAQVFKWAPGAKIDIPLNGKVLMLRAPSEPAVLARLAFSRPDAIVLLLHKTAQEERRKSRLIRTGSESAKETAIVSIPELDLQAAFDRLPVGLTAARASLVVPAPLVKAAGLRNVAGILRGSDPQLREQYLLVTAHYDHLGKDAVQDIYNGANDDASGVATVIELAAALARENPHPRRTLVFVCFFGEEKGLFGSTWYVNHPLVPLDRTIAVMNFEQMGEPARNEGLPASSLGVTGYDFSDLPAALEPDLASAGVSLREVRHNAEFFERSDNLPFAQAGVLAHTFVAALEFPDYHRTSDKWPKLNYENMAKLDNALAVAIVHLAGRAEAPQWNEDSKKAKDFLKAWRALHPGQRP